MKRLFGALSIILLISCGNSINGKIENRVDNGDCYYYDQNTYKIPETRSSYLINTSSNKTFEFTIKETETINDTIINYSTFKMKLSPGDERRISCTKFLVNELYSITNESQDTLIIYQNKNTVSPEKRITIERKYSCTGQREITNPKELDKLK